MIKKWFSNLVSRWTGNQAPAGNPVRKVKGKLARALNLARSHAKPEKNYNYPVVPPALMPGVLPAGVPKAQVAMDSAPYDFAQNFCGIGGAHFVGFPGYAYLSMLSTRAEYRMFAQAISISLTREWIELNSTDSAGDGTKAKITELTQAIKDIKLKDVIQLMAEHDSFFGRAQLLINIDGGDLELPLALSPKTVQKRTPEEIDSKGYGFSISAIEAIWTTPSNYNASDPAAKDFYKPSIWFMMGKQVHASRLLTVVTRPVADVLKPAFNFGGMSLSQLAEPYVDNWLRTRQSVSDLINNFSIVALQTAMEEVLDGDDNGENLLNRAELFTLHRSNKGLMLLDKDKEELVMLNVPIGGLAELQSQSQEQMCSVSHTPAVILLGIAPTGFGNVAEGEIRTFNDWVKAIWEAYWRSPIETVVNLLQLVMYGAIDPDIVISFEPLYQMTPKELAEIRTADAQTDVAYIGGGVIDPLEVREKIARNPESGYQGIDVTKIPDPGANDPDDDTGAGGIEDQDVP